MTWGIAREGVESIRRPRRCVNVSRCTNRFARAYARRADSGGAPSRAMVRPRAGIGMERRAAHPHVANLGEAISTAEFEPARVANAGEAPPLARDAPADGHRRRRSRRTRPKHRALVLGGEVYPFALFPGTRPEGAHPRGSAPCSADARPRPRGVRPGAGGSSGLGRVSGTGAAVAHVPSSGGAERRLAEVRGPFIHGRNRLRRGRARGDGFRLARVRGARRNVGPSVRAIEGDDGGVWANGEGLRSHGGVARGAVVRAGTEGRVRARCHRVSRAEAERGRVRALGQRLRTHGRVHFVDGARGDRPAVSLEGWAKHRVADAEGIPPRVPRGGRRFGGVLTTRVPRGHLVERARERVWRRGSRSPRRIR